jgi:hypothetical protein
MRAFIGVVGIVLGFAVMGQLSTANAATEVARFPANNSFLSANSNDDVTGDSTSILVTRELTQAGGPVYRISYIISNSITGDFKFGTGLIDTKDVHFSAHSASVDVDINAITLDQQVGELPEDGVISIEWQGTDDVQRISGGSVNVSDNVRFLFVGTSVDITADITGSVFGTPLVDPFGDIRILSEAVIVITRN